MDVAVILGSKPRILFSRDCFNRDGHGWLLMTYEGCCSHSTWLGAVCCLRNYYSSVVAKVLARVNPEVERVN